MRGRLLSKVINATETTTLALKWDSDRVLGFYSNSFDSRMKSQKSWNLKAGQVWPVQKTNSNSQSLAQARATSAPPLPPPPGPSMVLASAKPGMVGPGVLCKNLFAQSCTGGKFCRSLITRIVRSPCLIWIVSHKKCRRLLCFLIVLINYPN